MLTNKLAGALSLALTMSAGHLALAAERRACTPIRANLKQGPREVQKFLVPQIRRIEKMGRSPGRNDRNNSEFVSGQDPSGTYRRAKILTFPGTGWQGLMSSYVATRGRDGQEWTANINFSNGERETTHAFNVGKRSQLHTILGFPVGSRVSVKRTSVNGKVVKREMTAFDGRHFKLPIPAE